MLHCYQLHNVVSFSPQIVRVVQHLYSYLSPTGTALPSNEHDSSVLISEKFSVSRPLFCCSMKWWSLVKEHHCLHAELNFTSDFSGSLNSMLATILSSSNKPFAVVAADFVVILGDFMDFVALARLYILRLRRCTHVLNLTSLWSLFFTRKGKREKKKNKFARIIEKNIDNFYSNYLNHLNQTHTHTLVSF